MIEGGKKGERRKWGCLGGWVRFEVEIETSGRGLKKIRQVKLKVNVDGLLKAIEMRANDLK